MVLSRLTKITGPGVATDTNWVGNNADFTGITTTATSFNIGVTTIHSNLIEAHNIKSTGIITATGGSFSGNVTAVDGTFSGNVSIAGTLTYEDVTNIDAVGIITAPALDVDDFLDVGSNIKLGNAGVITATSFVGSGAALTGIDATAIKDSGGNVKIQAQASGAIHSGVSTFQDIDVDGHTNLDNVSVAGVSTFTGTVNLSTINSTASALTIHNTADRVLIKGSNRIDLADDQVRFQNRAQNASLLDATSSYVKLYQSGNERLATTSTGVQIDTILKLYGAAGNPGKLQLQEGGALSEIRVERSTDTSSALLFGTEISGTTATRAKIDTAGHFIPATDSTYDLGLTGTRWRNVYADTLYGDGSNLTGITQTTINSNTNNYIITGTGTANELQGESELQWNGSNLFVRAGESEAASLNLIADQGDDNGDGWKIQSEQDENDLTFKSNISGSYVDKLKLKSNGQLEVQGNITSTGKASFPDGNSNGVTIGNKSGGDLRIFHNGVNSYLENDTGNLVIDNGSGVDMYINSGNDIYIRPQGSQNGIVINGAGRVELYHNNSMKFWTQSWGAQLAGNFIPNGTNAYDLGASNERWRNIYTNDLHLSNEGSTNSIDNTWGDWTIQEGESDVYMINNRSGKKFKIKMEEVL